MRVRAKPAVVAKGRGEAKEATTTAVPRRRGATASNGRKRRGGSVAAAGKTDAAATSAVMYDSSDSFENHVIDLRGDQYRSATGRDEDDLKTRSSEEFSTENGNGQDESDSDIYMNRLNGHGNLSNGKTDKHRNEPNGDDRAEEYINGDSLRPRQHHFVPGQLAWAKFARFPWWPAQVMDKRETKEGRGGMPESDTDLLVRFFGTYDYGWVDPFVNLSDFEVKLAERSRIRKKALQKGVEEALVFQSSGELPLMWEPVRKAAKNKISQNGYSRRLTEPPKELKRTAAADNEVPKERKTPRKRKPKVLFEEGRDERKPQRLLRRLRIMRQLGLVAPAGSPFTSF